MNDMLHIENFEPCHFYTMRLRKEDTADFAGLDREELVQLWKHGRTLLHQEEPILIYGFTENRGTASLWAVTSQQTDSYPLFITRLALNGMARLFRLGIHRIEVYCHCKNGRSLAWLTRMLGFQVEGLMRHCGPNKQDRFLLAMTEPDWKKRNEQSNARSMRMANHR